MLRAKLSDFSVLIFGSFVSGYNENEMLHFTKMLKSLILMTKLSLFIWFAVKNNQK